MWIAEEKKACGAAAFSVVFSSRDWRRRRLLGVRRHLPRTKTKIQHLLKGNVQIFLLPEVEVSHRGRSPQPATHQQHEPTRTSAGA